MGFLSDALDRLFVEGLTCELCGREIFDGGKLCLKCLKTVTFNDGDTCPVCGRKNFAPEICLECKGRLPLYRRAVSPFVYIDGAAALISRFKNGAAHLKGYFAEKIREKLVGFEKIDFITFIPITAKKLKRRGYNQSRLLAESLSEKVLTPVEATLEKVKETPDQKGLSRRDREKNLEDCFKVTDRRKVKGKTILLVDDVMTTGATLDAAAKRLLAAGAAAVFAATVASVEYKVKNG